MATVRLENITRRFDNVTAIEGITLNIPDGQFWVFVGPSGCGKSTLLRTIAGLETATGGDIYIGDRRVNEVAARDRNVAMVFQNYALYPHMTVAQNLAFGLKMHKTDPATVENRIQKVARSLSVEHLLHRKPKQLSGGQQQRVALGRAIVREPDVFLLDEPLSNLDAQLRDDTRAELKQLHHRLGITTIYVTHDQVEAMTLADRIVILEKGRVQQVGDPQQIYAKPANRMVATFLGNPPMNVIPATYGNSLFWVGDQSLACPPAIREKLRPQEGQGFELGIRPEHLELSPTDSDTDRGQRDVWALDKVPLELEVGILEPLGRETLVRATWPSGDRKVPNGTTVQFIAPPGVRLRSGDRVPVQLDFNSLVIFDPHTGEVLYS